mmetsp:Transcript_8205/g.27080  ORF Transcript_8205/g.27080 Transcript_8205/m.27080 type:complete len:243 (-) Transcript_8205:187-915(-)
MGGCYSCRGWREEFQLESVCAAKRQPPLLPDDVRLLLETEKKFTTGKEDVEVVDALYRNFFEGVVGAATALNFEGLSWGSYHNTEAKALAAVLPHFVVLERLNLSRNALSAEGAYLAVADYLRGSKSLTSLELAGNGLGTAGAKALAPAISSCASLTSLDLSRTGLGPAGVKALIDGGAFTGSLTKLLIFGNGIGDDGAKAIADALNKNSACVLKKLVVDNKELLEHEGLKAACQLRGVELE